MTRAEERERRRLIGQNDSLKHGAKIHLGDSYGGPYCQRNNWRGRGQQFVSTDMPAIVNCKACLKILPRRTP